MAENKSPTNKNKQIRMRIQTLEALLSRANLASRLGQQYDTDRDIYEALGYKTTLYYADYATQYERQDIAKAVVNRPVDATWQGGVSVTEMDQKGDSALEKAWKELDGKFHLTTKFARLDKLSCLGRYGVLLLGFDDVRTNSEMTRPVKSGKRKLLYVKPLSENSATINAYVNDPQDERYGLPLNYSVSMKTPTGVTQSILVHYSRVLHITVELLESEIEGVPALKAVFNRLYDLEKLVGGSAEMFWRGARPGYQAKIQPDYQLTSTQQDNLQDELDEYEHNLRRILAIEGVDLQPLEIQVEDPRWHVDVQLQMISAVTGIPKRILVGSERGELASSQDKMSWLDLITDRREGYATLQIVRPFVDTLIKHGVLPAPKSEGKYSVVWKDLYAMSKKEKAQIGAIRASALKAYKSAPGTEAVMPEQLFLKYGLGLSEEEVDEVLQGQEKAPKGDSREEGGSPVARSTGREDPNLEGDVEE